MTIPAGNARGLSIAAATAMLTAAALTAAGRRGAGRRLPGAQHENAHLAGDLVRGP